jgi:hypothetical protein
VPPLRHRVTHSGFGESVESTQQLLVLCSEPRRDHLDQSSGLQEKRGHGSPSFYLVFFPVLLLAAIATIV